MKAASLFRLLGASRTNRAIRDEDGATAIEYALIVAAIVLGGFVTIYSGSMGSNLKGTFQTIANSV